jgi:hypothetical protein
MPNHSLHRTAARRLGFRWSRPFRGPAGGGCGFSAAAGDLIVRRWNQPECQQRRGRQCVPLANGLVRAGTGGH